MRIAHVLTRLCLLLVIAAPAAAPLPAMADPVAEAAGMLKDAGSLTGALLAERAAERMRER